LATSATEQTSKYVTQVSEVAGLIVKPAGPGPGVGKARSRSTEAANLVVLFAFVDVA
jgi:hypothetical protein